VVNGHNDAETTWDCENIGTGDTIAFWRDFSTVAKDRLLAFDGTQTGSDLVWANNFTHGERWNDLAPWSDETYWNE
jgi:hypothetical protein